MATEEADLRILDALKDGLPLEERPYAEIARRTGLTEIEVVERVQAMLADGRLRRLAAVVDYRLLGYVANALVVWKIPPERLEEAGRRVASFPEVTHCYARAVAPAWPYNLYAMVHARSEEELGEIIRTLDAAAGGEDRVVLRTEREFKKTSVPVRDIISRHEKLG